MISVTVLTKNREDLIGACLDALSSFPEVVVLDTGSTDRTLEIARKYPNVRIFLETFNGFGPLHNRAIELAQHDWILSIDSDEVLSLESREEILNLNLDPSCVYAIPRHNYFHGKRIVGCGWKQEWQNRLFHRATTKFSNDQVHEKVLVDGITTKRLSYPMFHYSHRDVADLLTKIQIYTTLFAKQNPHKKGSIFKACVKSSFAFFRAYFLRGGILDGREGFLLSKYMADTTFYKYAKLVERNEA